MGLGFRVYGLWVMGLGCRPDLIRGAAAQLEDEVHLRTEPNSVNADF